MTRDEAVGCVSLAEFCLINEMQPEEFIDLWFHEAIYGAPELRITKEHATLAYRLMSIAISEVPTP